MAVITEISNLNPASAPTSSDPSSDNYMSNVIEYMTALLLLAVNLTKSETRVNSLQSDLSQNFIELNKKQVETAKQAYKDYEKQLEDSKSANVFSQIFGGIAMGLGILLAGVTGGLTAFLVAGVITGLMFSGTFEKLDTALASSIGDDGLRSMVKFAIVIGITLAGCGIGGALDAGAANLVAKVGAEQAAAAAAKQLAQKAAQEEVVVNFQSAGAGASANAAGSGAVNAATEAAAPKVSQNFLSKAADRGFNKSNITLTSSQAMIAVNPFVDGIMQVLDWTDTGEEKKKFIANLVGTIIAMIVSLVMMRGGAALSTEKGVGEFGNLLRKTLGGPKALFAVDSLRNANFAASSGFQIAEGVTGLKMADTMKEIGQDKAALTIYQSLLDIMTDGIQAETSHYKGMSKSFQQMSQTFMAFIEPYLKAAEILG